MRRGKIILACAGLILIGSVIALLWHSNNPPSLPALEIEHVESGSGVIDGSGAEMSIVRCTLISANTNFDMLFIKTGATETRVSNHWIKVETNHDFFVPEGGNPSLGVFLAPHATDRCRMSVKYRLVSIPRGTTFLQRTLRRLELRTPPSFWNWLRGHQVNTPSPLWKEISLEADIPPATAPAGVF